ncbi:DUF2683 domain-containing protein [Candidatus Woesearchaeota archaeon]|nr:MAG: DUF2683 domain-containing protein [Candidatus Woesearchaeota archaeon]
MVQALIDISEHSNRILNILKAKYDLKDKSAAINLMAEQYEEELLEPELRPEYIQKIERIRKTSASRTFKDIKELRRHLENA